MLDLRTHSERSERLSTPLPSCLRLRDPETGEVAEIRFEGGVLVIQVPGHVVVDTRKPGQPGKIVLGASPEEAKEVIRWHSA